MKKIISLIITIILLFSLTSFTKASPIEWQIKEEIASYFNDGILDDFHLDYADDPAYQTFYFEKVHFGEGIEALAKMTKQEVQKEVEKYKNNLDNTWDYIIENLDIEPSYLTKNSYLGLYWDSYYANNKDNGILFLIWTTSYTPSEEIVLREIYEGNRIYKYYDDETNPSSLDSNWLWTSHYHFKEDDISIHLTAISGIYEGKEFGLPLKQKYAFDKFTFGLDRGQVTEENAYYFDGMCTTKIEFDLGLTPKLDGKNSMQLVTHGYEIIKECEAQSYFDLIKYGGYGHFVYFNTTIPIDKIYRVDVAYKVTNDEKNWYEFWLPSDEHQLTKSLTPEKVIGGIFGLFKFQGFEEGNYASTINNSTNYKYKLHLNYDDDAWRIFTGGDLIEANYKRISNFQILRMNYLVDNTTYDVPIKMDTIEGDTLFILDDDLILDTDSIYYDIKNTIDDIFNKIKDTYNNYKTIFLVVGGIILSIFLIWLISKIYKIFKNIINNFLKDKK